MSDRLLSWTSVLYLTFAAYFVGVFVYQVSNSRSSQARGEPVVETRTLTPEERSRQKELFAPVWERYREGTLVGAPAEQFEELFSLADETTRMPDFTLYFFGDPEEAEEGHWGHLRIGVLWTGECPRVYSAAEAVYVH